LHEALGGHGPSLDFGVPRLQEEICVYRGSAIDSIIDPSFHIEGFDRREGKVNPGYLIDRMQIERGCATGVSAARVIHGCIAALVAFTAKPARIVGGADVILAGRESIQAVLSHVIRFDGPGGHQFTLSLLVLEMKCLYLSLSNRLAIFIVNMSGEGCG